MVVGLIIAITALVFERVLEAIVTVVRTKRERREWIEFLDEWLSGSLRVCRTMGSILRRFLRPWQEFERTVSSGSGIANLPEFPMLRLDRPDVELGVTGKYPLLRTAIDPTILLRINGELRLIRRSSDSLIHLSLRAAESREMMRTQPPMSQSVVGEMRNSISLIEQVTAMARQLPSNSYPKSRGILDTPDEGWSDVPPLMPGPHECRPRGQVVPPARIEVTAELVETAHGTMRLLRTVDGRIPEEAFPNHEWRELPTR